MQLHCSNPAGCKPAATGKRRPQQSSPALAAAAAAAGHAARITSSSSSRCNSQQQQQQQQQQCRRHAPRVVTTAAAASDLWTPDKDAAMLNAMSQLQGLVDTLPELPDEVQGALAVKVPGLLETPAPEVRERLQKLSAALELDFVTTARLISKVPLLWNRSPEAAAAKLSSVATTLGVAVPAAAALYMAVPALASINMPGVVRDRVDGLSDALGVTVAQAAQMVGRQPMLWVVSRSDVRTTVPALATALGLPQQQQQQPSGQQQQQQQQPASDQQPSTDNKQQQQGSGDATTLAERMPVLLACETDWLRLNVTELASKSGLSPAALLDLVARYPALATLDTAAVLSGLEEVSSSLEVSMSDALNLVTQQPTLLLAKPPAILGSLDVLSAALKLQNSSDALGLLVRCPQLLYDITIPAIQARLEQLSVVLACDSEEARQAALRAPVLLVIPASVLQTALAAAAEQLGQQQSALTDLLLTDPGSLLSMSYMGGPNGAADSWAARLNLDPEAVTALVAAQPALLELSPNTLRARLESLAALFDVPAPAAAQLLLKHPALAAIPPNVTITRAKQLSIALRCSMARAGELIAKVPALLLLPASTLGPASLGGTPVDTVLNTCATYEWYTSQWLMAAAKERAPQQMTSFASMHS